MVLPTNCSGPSKKAMPHYLHNTTQTQQMRRGSRVIDRQVSLKIGHFPPTTHLNYEIPVGLDAMRAPDQMKPGLRHPELRGAVKYFVLRSHWAIPRKSSCYPVRNCLEPFGLFVPPPSLNTCREQCCCSNTSGNAAAARVACTEYVMWTRQSVGRTRKSTSSIY